MATIRIYNFNNYYNRKYKVYDDLEDYGEPIYVETGSNVNFNPNDGVNTQYTAGRQMNVYNGKGDYLIYSEDNTSITSRWFIIEQSYNRLGQYALMIRRDVLADNPSWKTATTFIEKCTLNSSSPFIYNQEDMTFNEIKTAQKPLYDKTGCSWIVGFVPKNLQLSNPKITISDSVVDPDIVITTSMDEWISSLKKKKYYDGIESWRLYYTQRLAIGSQVNYQILYTDKAYWAGSSQPSPGIYTTTTDAPVIPKPTRWPSLDGLERIFVEQYADIYDMDGLYTGALTGKIVRTPDGKLYRTGSLSFKSDKTQNYFANGTELFDTFNDVISYVSGLANYGSGATNNTYSNIVKWLQITDFTYEPYEKGTYEIDFSKGINYLNDAPYTMFVLPYGEITQEVGSNTIKSDRNISMIIASGLNSYSNTDDDKVFSTYDVQMVPYCPLPDASISDAKITYNENNRVVPITKGGDTVGYIYMPSLSSKTFELSNLTESEFINFEGDYDLKTTSACSKYRLVAPNFTSSYEFDIAKNGGSVTKYQVSLTYKPFSSYIKICPKFKGLYGDKNFQDTRGLICNGVSLPKTTNAFNEMKLNQRYYQDVFDRQIQHMETENKYQRVQQAIGAGVSALGTGLTTGAITGNVGVGIGAGITSAGAGFADYQITRALQNEALDYTKDNFGYQLQTIKAQPNTLSRTADYNADTIFVPVIETYVCTFSEQINFIRKVVYNGMTAMFIGIPVDYFSGNYIFFDGSSDKGYFKGIPIRLEEISDDYHMAKAVAEELNKGVYMK